MAHVFEGLSHRYNVKRYEAAMARREYGPAATIAEQKGLGKEKVMEAAEKFCEQFVMGGNMRMANIAAAKYGISEEKIVLWRLNRVKMLRFQARDFEGKSRVFEDLAKKARNRADSIEEAINSRGVKRSQLYVPRPVDREALRQEGLELYKNAVESHSYFRARHIMKMYGSYGLTERFLAENELGLPGHLSYAHEVRSGNEVGAKLAADIHRLSPDLQDSIRKSVESENSQNNR